MRSDSSLGVWRRSICTRWVWVAVALAEVGANTQLKWYLQRERVRGQDWSFCDAQAWPSIRQDHELGSDEVAARLSLKLDGAVLCGASCWAVSGAMWIRGTPRIHSPKEICSLPHLTASAVRINHAPVE